MTSWQRSYGDQYVRLAGDRWEHTQRVNMAAPTKPKQMKRVICAIPTHALERNSHMPTSCLMGQSDTERSFFTKTFLALWTYLSSFSVCLPSVPLTAGHHGCPPLKEDECVIMFKVTEGREEDKNVSSWPGEEERGIEWGDMWNLVCWPTQSSLKLFLCLFPIS